MCGIMRGMSEDIHSLAGRDGKTMKRFALI